MSKVAVIDSQKNPLAPCHPAVARRLLKHKYAAIWRKYPFTIILKKAVPLTEIATASYTLSWSPGAKASGLAIVSESGEIVYAAVVYHRNGKQTGGISWGLTQRTGFRRGRRTRNLRHRPPRWANRARKVPVLTQHGWEYQSAEAREETDASKSQNDFNRVSMAKLLDKRYRWERLPRTKTNIKQKKRWRRIRIKHQKVEKNGWVAPSLMSRVFNLETWTRRLCKIYPIVQLAIKNVKFDTRLLGDPNTHDIRYQHGTLPGREIREYLLELTGRKCAYCGDKRVPLQVEHIIPKAVRVDSRLSNLTMACQPCNDMKGALHGKELEEKLGADFAKKVQAAARKSKKGLSDAAAVNTIRWKLYETLKGTGLPVITGTGGKTAYHRNLAGLPKTYYYDAASISSIPKPPKFLKVAVIKSVGYGRRDLRKFSVKRPGFNYGGPKRTAGDGFRKYDHVEMLKSNGSWKGIINCFENTPKGKPRKLRVQYFAPDLPDSRKSGNTSELRLLQKRDGYSYDSFYAR